MQYKKKPDTYFELTTNNEFLKFDNWNWVKMLIQELKKVLQTERYQWSGIKLNKKKKEEQLINESFEHKGKLYQKRIVQSLTTTNHRDDEHLEICQSIKQAD